MQVNRPLITQKDSASTYELTRRIEALEHSVGNQQEREIGRARQTVGDNNFVFDDHPREKEVTYDKCPYCVVKK